MKAYCCATGECAWSWPASLRYVRCCGNACAHPCARGGVLHDTREQSRTTVNPMLFLFCYIKTKSKQKCTTDVSFQRRRNKRF